VDLGAAVMNVDKRNMPLLTAVMAIQDYCRNRLMQDADSSSNVHIFPHMLAHTRMNHACANIVVCYRELVDEMLHA